MKQAILKKGIVYPVQVSLPAVDTGRILVEIKNSCISSGTEMSGVASSSMNLVQRAIRQPDNVKKVIDAIKINGLLKTFTKVKGKIEGGTELGYSAAGIVIDIGSDVSDFSIGDRVAVAGVGYANHAEYVSVPVNLSVKMPAEVNFQDASTVALGAIAIQGIRRADLKFGESCLVVGAGILGLIATQILVASGVRVCVSDLDDNRLALAKKFGAELTINPVTTNAVDTVSNWTGGWGVDAAIFMAATSSSEPLSKCFQMCRKKATVVLVGVSGMEIKREDIFKKELDFKISTSYGPGRYDEMYEELGCDYPYAYVRWTERRNMEEFLRLLSMGSVNLSSMITDRFSIEKVSEAYQKLSKADEKPLMVLLEYDGNVNKDDFKQIISNQEKKTKTAKGCLNVALIGAGSFATAVHLPNMAAMPEKYNIYAICNRTGHKAKQVCEQFGAEYSTTNVEDILNDSKVDLVIIATRHNNHGSLVLQSLKAGKNVFVEKPLAATRKELNCIRDFYKDNIDVSPMLFVGFNRRFSPTVTHLKKLITNRISPVIISYRMNVPFCDSDSWLHRDGGRIVGEACHIIDLVSAVIGTSVASVNIMSMTPNKGKYLKSDNKVINLKYDDGSIATISYFSIGSSQISKEYMDVHYDGKTIVLDDYKTLTGYGVDVGFTNLKSSQKGQREELVSLYASLQDSNKDWPISLDDIFQTTDITLLAIESGE